MRLKTLFSLFVILAMATLYAAAAPISVVVVVDESGSMAGEHAWLPTMISSLDSKLATLGITATYGLYGFGSSGAGQSGRELLDGGTAAQFAAAAAGLVISGSVEDGYAGLNFAFTNFSFPADAARNYILVTDEDRDDTNSALTYANILSSLLAQKALLNVVVNNPYTCSAGAALGVDSNSNGYTADGFGGFTSCANPVVGNGAGFTETTYVPMALATGGAAWNLNLLRAGGATAQSFTAAFVDIKVQEIQEQTEIPEPATLLLCGTALLGLGILRRRSAKRA
ncbi:MAG: PEP-CTERM sorting domain-containing protein [Bryobacterales bacterium]|nr:PEP-CTERM sorting domain-containing protein [Bryobacterales bacterium]